MMLLTSVDFANILRNMAYKRHLVNLNKTQVNKLLFMCYGLYLAFYGEKLFSETPKAWPYGPGFPNVYKWYSLCRVPIVITEEKNKDLSTNIVMSVLMISACGHIYLVDPGTKRYMVSTETKTQGGIRR